MEPKLRVGGRRHVPKSVGYHAHQYGENGLGGERERGICEVRTFAGRFKYHEWVAKPAADRVGAVVEHGGRDLADAHICNFGVVGAAVVGAK